MFIAFKKNEIKKLVRAAGVEPATFGFGGQHSIQLSYARNLTSIPARAVLFKWISTAKSR
jgi:hypothetical protein